MTSHIARISPRLILGTLLLAAGAGVVSPSCSSPQSLIELDVTGDQPFGTVTLNLIANAKVEKSLMNVNIDPPNSLPVGMYLPGDVTGTVVITATVTSGVCIVGRGTTTISGVTAGKTAGPVSLIILNQPCEIIPASTGGSSGAGGSPGGLGGTFGGQGGTFAGAGGTFGGLGGTFGGLGGTFGGSGGTFGGQGGTFAGAGGTIGGLGGAIGGLGGAIGGLGGSPVTGCGALIDDMESNTGYICQGNGRIGHWFTYSDSLVGTTVTPPSTQIPALPETITPSRGTSTRAMHFHGTTNASGYAGIGLVLNNAVINQTPGTFNASAYSGIQMYIRGTGSVKVIVQTSGTESDLYGGSCNSSVLVCAGNQYATSILTDWTLLSVPFTLLTGGSATLTKTDLWSIEIGPYSYGAFDFWVDDIAFY